MARANLSDKERILELEASLAECQRTIASLRKELEEERARAKYLSKELSTERKQKLESVLVGQGGLNIQVKTPKGGIPMPALVPFAVRPKTKTSPTIPTQVPDSLSINEIMEMILRPFSDIECWCILHEVGTVLVELHAAKQIHGSVSLKSIRIDKSAKLWTLQDYVGVPELPKGEEVTIKSDIYCLGASVWSAADYLLDYDEEPVLSEQICALIEKMTAEDTSIRPTAEEIKTAAASYALQSRYIFTALLQEVDRKKLFRKEFDNKFAEKHKTVFNDVLSEIVRGVKLKPVTPPANKRQNASSKSHAELLVLRKSSSRLLKSRLSGNHPSIFAKDGTQNTEIEDPRATKEPNKAANGKYTSIVTNDAAKDAAKDVVKESPKDTSTKESKESTKTTNRYSAKDIYRGLNKEVTKYKEADNKEREAKEKEKERETKEKERETKEKERDTKEKEPKEIDADNKESPKENDRESRKDSHKESHRERHRERRREKKEEKQRDKEKEAGEKEEKHKEKHRHRDKHRDKEEKEGVKKEKEKEKRRSIKLPDSPFSLDPPIFLTTSLPLGNSPNVRVRAFSDPK